MKSRIARPFGVDAEVGPLDAIQQVAAAAEARRAGGGVAKRQEHAAAVAAEPVERELAAEALVQPDGARERDQLDVAVAATGQGVALDVRRRRQVDHAAQRRIVVEQRQAGEGAPPVVVERRLRVRAEQLVARGAPQPPGALRIAERPDLGVQLGDPPPPVPEAT